jgi:hypothetical protein
VPTSFLLLDQHFVVDTPLEKQGGLYFGEVSSSLLFIISAKHKKFLYFAATNNFPTQNPVFHVWWQ